MAEPIPTFEKIKDLSYAILCFRIWRMGFNR